jgi:hypothetical protein
MNHPPERVYTMPDYYDGPRGGLANFGGRPHIYRSLWADIDRKAPDVFELIPIDAETLALALEDWEIWRRWEAAYAHKEVAHETHPAIPAGRARHEELAAMLESRLSVRIPTPVTAVGEFEWPSTNYPGLGSPISVRWTVVERPSNCAIPDDAIIATTTP